MHYTVQPLADNFKSKLIKTEKALISLVKKVFTRVLTVVKIGFGGARPPPPTPRGRG